MRVAHITDIHVEQPMQAGELLSKRALAAANLHLLGRARKFDLGTVRALVPAVLQARPDLVVCTGDVTSTGTEAEFQLAAELLAPIARSHPLLMLPGNHDVYVRSAVGRLEHHFAQSVPGGGYPYLARHGGVDFIALDVSRPWPTSQGHASNDQLERFSRLLSEGDGPCVVMLHYPLRGRDGAPYRPFTRNLANAARIESVLASSPRVLAVLHGHEHHGYRTTIPLGTRTIPSFDPGASGYAFLPTLGRTAHFNVYEIDAAGAIEVERHRYDGRRFELEPGGAYASGR